MTKNIFKNRILPFVLLTVILISSITQPSYSKYVYPETGRAWTSLLSGNGFTDTFVVTNDALNVTFDSDGNSQGSATSKSLFGINEGDSIDLNNSGATYTIGNYSSDFALDQTSDLTFVIHNASDYTLVACFDVIICMGWISSNIITCTVSAPTATADSTDKTSLVLTAGINQDTDIELNHHKETTDGNSWLERENQGNATPIIDVSYSNLAGLVDYSAYSFHLDPSDLKYRQYSGDPIPTDNQITLKELTSFLLVPSGATRTFEFSFTGTGGIFSGADKNAFASIAMTAKVVTDPELLN